MSTTVRHRLLHLSPALCVPMTMSALDTVRSYHQQTKHQFDGYARSLGYLDWANQPDPFRRYRGCPLVPLVRGNFPVAADYDAIRCGELPAAHPGDVQAIGRLLWASLALSAWKQTKAGDRWAVRVNPSSGNLHPTEAYLLSVDRPGLSAGLYHYAPFHHALERRAEITTATFAQLGLAPDAMVVVLTSIPWREAWKYGERAFRYCQHDVGHAVAALSLAAGMLGWRCAPLLGVDHRDLARLAGIADHGTGPEAEIPELAVVITPTTGGTSPSPSTSVTVVREPRRAVITPTHGMPNRLSKVHHDWPIISEVSAATAVPGWTTEAEAQSAPVAARASSSSMTAITRTVDALPLVRHRRSAVAMDGRTGITRDEWLALLTATRAPASPTLFASMTLPPAVALLVFVHRVSGCEPGLYLLGRAEGHLTDLRPRIRPDFTWEVPTWCPPELALVRLWQGDVGETARTLSCYQAIAADGAFAVAMLARFDDTLVTHGPSAYRHLYWECGVIGQVLYLEAEALTRPDRAIRGTGIGCFFDDGVHDLLGFNLSDGTSDRVDQSAWQSLYHFTIGGPVDDQRLVTTDPYVHDLAPG